MRKNRKRAQEAHIKELENTILRLKSNLKVIMHLLVEKNKKYIELLEEKGKKS
jgi:hypothetical protein